MMENEAHNIIYMNILIINHVNQVQFLFCLFFCYYWFIPFSKREIIIAMFRRATLTASVHSAQTRTIAGGAHTMYKRYLKANNITLKYPKGQYQQVFAKKFESLSAAKKAEFKKASNALPQKAKNYPFNKFCKEQAQKGVTGKGKGKGPGGFLKAVAKLWKATQKKGGKKK
jgi:hypothetical protein